MLLNGRRLFEKKVYILDESVSFLEKEWLDEEELIEPILVYIHRRDPLSHLGRLASVPQIGPADWSPPGVQILIALSLS